MVLEIERVRVIQMSIFSLRHQKTKLCLVFVIIQLTSIFKILKLVFIFDDELTLCENDLCLIYTYIVTKMSHQYNDGCGD